MKKAKLNTKNLLKGAVLSAFLLFAGVLAFNAMDTNSLSENSELALTTDNNGGDYVLITNDKCGGDDKSTTTDAKSTESKCGEGKCGEGKCGGDDKAAGKECTCEEGNCTCGEGKCSDGKCGEGKCGGDDKAESKDAGKEAESKCGEGKCG